jgi:hypothetical protein
MIWFYRGSEGALQIETRIDARTKEYVLQIEWPGRPPAIERFLDRGTFDTRVLAVERQLTAEHWEQVGGPAILPHGWHGDPQN